MAIILYPERTRLPADVVVGKSPRERDMPVPSAADPKDRIICRALSVANREFAYTIMYTHLAVAMNNQ
jgi:hypothetical protein